MICPVLLLFERIVGAWAFRTVGSLSLAKPTDYSSPLRDLDIKDFHTGQSLAVTARQDKATSCMAHQSEKGFEYAFCLWQACKNIMLSYVSTLYLCRLQRGLRRR